MGFIDLGASLGRRFGSLGVALNEVATRLTVRAASHLTVSGPSTELAMASARALSRALAVPAAVAIDIEQAIPQHVGLGSGTQMALALGVALSRFYGLDVTVRDIARLIERGERSGIGIAVFEQGGFIIDGGRGPRTRTPPVIVRMDVPSDWRFIVIFDESGQGLHGQDEVAAFKSLPPFPADETARLCHRILMQALPALAEQDIQRFGAVISELQRSVGEYFASVQGGRFTSPAVSEALGWLEREGAVGIGQSSWGPTGFCLIGGIQRAQALFRRVEAAFAADSGLRFLLASGRNRGADIGVGETADRSALDARRANRLAD
jgi:beta-ribofuranosylaminobenzene 5'-phosphate synthase